MPQPDKDQMIEQMLSENRASMEMPKYKCHKTVWALKIKEISILPSSGAEIVPDDSNYGPIHIDSNYLRKHNPQAGGYYVVYADGYQSYSPAKAFEEGYTRM